MAEHHKEHPDYAELGIFAGYGETQKIPYVEWLVSVRLKFPVLEEFDLASAIYSFQAAYDDGLTPQQAYDDFDAWVSA